VRITDLRIKRCMRDEDAAAWARALAEPGWWATAEVLKDEPGSSWVRRAMINGRAVAVKCRYLNTSSRRIKSMLGCGHGDKHWRGAALLASKKIATARPVVMGTARVDGVLVELLVLNYLSGPTLLEVMDQIRRGVGPDVREQHRIAAAAGRLVGAMLAAGLVNRDHKPSNLVVCADARGDAGVAIIDVVGLRSCGRLGFGEAEGERMFASMWIEPSGLGCPPRRSLWMRAMHGLAGDAAWKSRRVERHREVRAFVGAVAGLIAGHGDSRPSVDPLARTQGRSGRPVAPTVRGSAGA
jgi:hypothetical protein